MDLKISLIVPVYNRPHELEELLVSLANQSNQNFELVVVEDGSTLSSKPVVERFGKTINIQYFTKPNTGPGPSRNFGCQNANGNFFIFVDSDCILPQNYFEIIHQYLSQNPLDCFGGPDDAHESFSDLQKAVNYAMTSFFTTGGIRGGAINPDKFHPRSFNMGFSKAVFEAVGGFPEVQYSRSKAAGEDIELSMLIKKAGFKVGLIKEAVVYHKRRTSWQAFAQQTYGFGYARVTLAQRNQKGLKLVHLLPLAFLGYLVLAMCLFWFLGKIVFLPLAIFSLLLFVGSFVQFKSLIISVQSVLAGVVQLLGYGLGLAKGFWDLAILGKQKFLNQFSR